MWGVLKKKGSLSRWSTEGVGGSALPSRCGWPPSFLPLPGQWGGGAGGGGAREGSWEGKEGGGGHTTHGWGDLWGRGWGDLPPQGEGGENGPPPPRGGGGKIKTPRGGQD